MFIRNVYKYVFRKMSLRHEYIFIYLGIFNAESFTDYKIKDLHIKIINAEYKLILNLFSPLPLANWSLYFLFVLVQVTNNYNIYFKY